MDNQHRQIKGYRELSQEEIDLMNRIKSKGAELGALIEDLQAAQVDPRSESMRWIAIGKTHMQQGLMALTRSVAKPEFF